ncbi:hypothetical protein LA52FAK_38860 [Desulforhopalus sp. 52FAK]
MSTAVRAKLIEHMKLAGFSEHSQRSYINGVKGLANYYDQSPEKLTNGQVHMYFRYLVLERKLSWATCSSYMCGILYFFRHLCKRKVDDRFGLPPRVRSKKLPIVLSMEEVSRVLSCTKNLKHRVMLKTIYSAGLRVSEAVHLKPEHIESDPSRMMIRVEQGKGQKDRYTVLSENLLIELRNYWREYTPGQWLFPGKSLDAPVSTSTVSRVFYRAKKKLA